MKNARVVMLDEATASCDVTTDALVQAVIREVFEGCTCITIAHRLHSIADSDRIMVLANGGIVEFDPGLVLMPSTAVLLNPPCFLGDHRAVTGGSSRVIFLSFQ